LLITLLKINEKTLDLYSKMMYIYNINIIQKDKNMKAIKKILIGGKALVNLGSSRGTNDTDFLINNTNSKDAFIFDKENNVDYLNANGNKFFAEIFEIEKDNEIASPQSLIELKAYALVQHCQNMKFQKADDCEFDIKFLCRKFELKSVKIVNKYVSAGELSEIKKIINSVKY